MMRTSKRQANSRELATGVLLAFAASFFAFLVIFCVDMLASQVNWWRFGADPDRYVRIPVAEFHHGFAPNKRYLDRWGDQSYTFFTNSLGFRDSRNREVPLRSDRRRILFMGDSFTEASGIPYELSFVGRIGQKLESRGVEVLNGGTSSYSGLIYWKKTEHLLEKVGLVVDHVVLMLDISDIYDSTTYSLDRNGNVIRRRFLKRVQEFVEGNTILSGKLSGWAYGHYLRWRYWNFPGESREAPGGSNDPLIAINHHHALWTIRDDLYNNFGQSGLENETYNLVQLRKLLKRKGIELTLAVYPWPDQIWYRDYNSRQVTYWQNWAKEQGVSFVNLFPAFFSAETENVLEVIQKNYIAGDVHWNEHGHAVVAEYLLRFIAGER